MTTNEKALALHEKLNGKLETVSKVPVKSREDLALAYTPGVAEPCKVIAQDKEAAYTYTMKANTIAVVSDGSAVLGLGNIGAQAAIPVMEGKAVLFKEFGGVDAVPVCLDTQDTEEIIRTVKNIAPCFGGINLEDIASPRCFEIERRLEEELPIPVFHDDQHGTGIVVTAALLNALKVVGKKIEDVKIVLNGPGAAGTAIIKMMLAAGAKYIIACDENGILYNASREVNLVSRLEILHDYVFEPGIMEEHASGAGRSTEVEIVYVGEIEVYDFVEVRIYPFKQPYFPWAKLTTSVKLALLKRTSSIQENLVSNPSTRFQLRSSRPSTTEPLA